MNEEENLTPAEEAEAPAPEPEEAAPEPEEEESPKGKKGRKKGKKEKKPKAKKEKKPREKKPKKKKKGKGDDEEPPEGEEGEEGEEPKKKGLFANKKLLLIILIGVVVLAGVAVFLLIRVFGVIGGDKEKPPKETEEVVETEAPEETEELPEELPEEPPEETPAPTETPSGQIRTGMTTVEVADYIKNLTPSSLGLPGEDMTGYDVFVSESLIVIDGHYCTQVTVYSDGTAGTNEIEGVYYISRDSAHLLYRYDVQAGTVTPITP